MIIYNNAANVNAAPPGMADDGINGAFVLIPTVNGDNNQHAHDENLRVGHFLSGTEIVYSLLTTP